MALPHVGYWPIASLGFIRDIRVTDPDSGVADWEGNDG
jgi:hypothetical protein